MSVASGNYPSAANTPEAVTSTLSGCTTGISRLPND
jgi:hypothetical protein